MRITILGVLASLALLGCTEATGPSPGPQTVLLYFSDFESPADSMGWEGQGDFSLRLDSMKTESPQCLAVVGTDVLPHAKRMIDTLSDSTEIIFRFEARSPSGRDGAVMLGTQYGPRFEARVTVNDSLWKWYADTAYIPSGSILEVWIEGDGMLGRPILVDNLEVRRVVR